MSILSRPVAPSSTASDDAVRRYIAAVRRHADPDPLFRRRLRGTIVNRYVAVQEGAIIPRTRQASRMGTLGRACLYASFALAVSVGSAMAASEGAVPGELLYPLKRNVESLRLQMLPTQYHDELAVEALSARIMELTVLLESGQVALAASLSGDIRESYEQLVALNGNDGPRGLLRPHLDQLDVLLARLPDAARASVERAMTGAGRGNASHGTGPGPDPGSSGWNHNAGRGTGSSSNGAGAAGVQGSDGPADQDRTPKPDPTPKPTPKPKPKPTPKSDADDTPVSQPTPQPEPEPEREPDGAPGSNGS